MVGVAFPPHLLGRSSTARAYSPLLACVSVCEQAGRERLISMILDVTSQSNVAIAGRSQASPLLLQTSSQTSPVGSPLAVSRSGLDKTAPGRSTAVAAPLSSMGNNGQVMQQLLSLESANATLLQQVTEKSLRLQQLQDDYDALQVVPRGTGKWYQHSHACTYTYTYEHAPPVVVP